MTLRQRLQNLINQQRAMLDKAKNEGRLFTTEEKTAWDKLEGEIKGVKELIAMEDSLNQTNADLNGPAANSTGAGAEPAGNSGAPGTRIEIPNTPQNRKIYVGLGEQMRDIKLAASGHVDDRLIKVMNATGMSGKTGEDGAFPIQTDFAGMLLESAVKDDPLLSRVDKLPITREGGGARWIEIDEKDVSTTIFGGVIVYWAAEAATAVPSKPKLAEKKLELEKLMGLIYTTYEMEQDTTYFDSLINSAFGLGIQRELGAAIMAGTGVGKNLGLLNASNLVTVAKETNQAAGTIVWENIKKMYHRGLNIGSGYMWFINPDSHEQLETMALAIGTAGVPVYAPGNIAGPIPTLRGLPVISTDHCPAAGSVGDIVLTDPSKYILIYKGTVDKAMSIHVQFLTAENAYRFIFRANGMPKQRNALRLKNTTVDRSYTVTLAARA